MEKTLQQHWEHVYRTKQPHEVSWTQDVPITSLELIAELGISKDTAVIDVGGGDSRLVDHLLDLGFTDVTVLDISAASLERARQRLGSRASQVKWIEADIREFRPAKKYGLWHDRAAFHFLTEEEDVRQYLRMVADCVDGYMIVGTFSSRGPEKCSGLPVRQYDEATLSRLLPELFRKVRCVSVDHVTPFDTKQHFTFCSFRRQAA
jgi:SAM-dependent methyltransferase